MAILLTNLLERHALRCCGWSRSPTMRAWPFTSPFRPAALTRAPIACGYDRAGR
jgi:hypothetical protein